MEQNLELLKLEISDLKKERDQLKKEVDQIEQQTREEISRFSKVASLINSSLDIDIVLDRIIIELRRLFHIEGVVIMLVNKERTHYTFYKVSFPEYLKEIEERLVNIAFPLDIESGGSMAESILCKKMFYFPEVDYSQIKNPRNRLAAEAMKIQSNIMMPVILKDEAIGSIMMSTHTRQLFLSDNELEALKSFIEQIGTAIHNSLLYSELKKERESLEDKVRERTIDLEKTILELEKAQAELKKRNYIIEKDLSYARKIQLGIIPTCAPEFTGYEIFTSYTPLDKLGGDLFDFIKIDDDLLGVLMCDVSGHGVPAAFITTMIKIGMPYNRVIQSNPNVFFEYLRDNLNYHMHGMYFTGVYCVLNRSTNSLTFSNAGHLPIILVRDGEIHELIAEGTVIGFEYNIDFNVEKVDLQKGDRIILYTDGITEAMGNLERSWENFYGQDRFYAFIKENYKMAQREFVTALYDDIFNYTKHSSFNDDVAIIIIDKKDD